MSETTAVAVGWIAAAITVCAIASCTYLTAASRDRLEAEQIARCETGGGTWIAGGWPWEPKCRRPEPTK